jgi:hypothetical protein
MVHINHCDTDSQNYRTDSWLKDIRLLDPEARIILTVIDLGLTWPGTIEQELKSLVFKTQHLAFEILADKPPSDAKLEGRGVYHRGPKKSSEYDRFYYVKGTGSQLGLQDDCDTPISDAMAKYPMYGGSSRDLFFDDITYSLKSAPRIIGGENLIWGSMELVNSAVLLNQLVDQFDCENLEDVRKFGFTIPICMSLFPDLSQAVREVLEQKARSESNVFRRSACQSEEVRIGYGTVLHEVPSNSRLFNGQSDDGLIKILDSERINDVAGSLLTLLKAGLVFSSASSHLQNLYDCSSSCGVADFSDMLFLGGCSPLCQSDELWWIPEYGASVADQQIAAIEASFGFAFGLLGLASADAEENDLDGKLERAQLAFFETLTSDIVDPSIWKSLLPLFPIYQKEISFALARVLQERYQSCDWERAARLRKIGYQAVSLFPELESAYKERETDWISHSVGRYLEWNAIQGGIVDQFLRLFQTSDLTHLEAIPDVIALSSLLDATKVVRNRADILSKVWGYQNRVNDILYIEGCEKAHGWQANRGIILETIARTTRHDETLGYRVTKVLKGLCEPLSDSCQLFGFSKESFLRDHIHLICTADDVQPLVEKYEWWLMLIQFYRAACGMTSILDAISGEQIFSIFTLHKELGLDHPETVIVNEALALEQKNPLLAMQIKATLEEWIDFASTRYSVKNPKFTEELVRFNSLRDRLHVPYFKVWHDYYLATEIMRRRLNDSISSTVLLTEVEQEVRRLSSFLQR